MINLITIYDVVNIFSMKNYKSLRKLRVGVNRYTGVNWSTTTRSINLSLSQFLKDGCIGERQMALVCKKHKRPEGQQVAHILTLNLYQATTLSVKDVPRIKRNKLFA